MIGSASERPQSGGVAVGVPVAIAIASAMDLIWSTINGHTGRDVRGDSEYRKARAWYDAGPSGVIEHQYADEFVSGLGEVKCLTGTGLIFCRGRNDETAVEKWDELGPPPPGRGRAGRYNRHGESVLYLSDQRHGVERELSPARPLFVQEYRLNVQDVRIADFTPSANVASLINAVFDHAELVEEFSDDDPSNANETRYWFSQAVAQLVARVGFDGMCVPGVRAREDGRHYRNLVIFQPGDRWRSWSRREEGTSRVD
jgi:hypothetical protein